MYLTEKRAIILVSFGTLQKEGNCIDAMMHKINREFPGYMVRNVFTSFFILNKTKEKGSVFSLKETLESLLCGGYEKVVILPTLLTAGEEYQNKVVKVASQYLDKFQSLKIGLPLFESGCDLAAILRAVRRQGGEKRDGEEIVLMGHGSKSRHNDVYEKLQQEADRIYTDISIGVLEENDHPNFAHVWQRLKSKKRNKVYLMPLLFTAGMHVKKDMLEGEQSWRHKFSKRGIDVRAYPHGLGEKEEFQNIYIKNFARMLDEFQV